MTFRELVQFAAQEPWYLLGIFAAVPLLALLTGLLHGEGAGGKSPWKYVYAVLIYLSCFCGIFTLLLTAYMLFFTKESLLDVNVLVYVLPTISMIMTLILIRRNVSFDEVPGFGRLWGLMVMIGITFVVVLAIQKTRIWLAFGSSFFTLLLVVAVLFAILKWSSDRVLGRSRQREGPGQ